MATASSLVYMTAFALMASYTLASHRARAAIARNQAMLQELEEANRNLMAYSERMEQLTIARERSRLGRELHDSVTQSIFSLTLTSQSAMLLLERTPSRVGEQLSRMKELTEGALAEMQMLISKLSPSKITEGGLVVALRRHINETLLPDGQAVSLEVEGNLPLTPEEEQGLFRIIQESLNNIVKHAGASQATIRLHLTEPVWIVIEDNGRGFNLPQARNGDRVGLLSMGERAAEIGWNLQIFTSPGSGTNVHLDKSAHEKLKPFSAHNASNKEG